MTGSTEATVASKSEALTSSATTRLGACTIPLRSAYLHHGEYRDSEVDAAHPLQALAAAAAAAGRSAPAVTLAPLGDEVIGDLVADLLEHPADEVSSLAALVKSVAAPANATAAPMRPIAPRRVRDDPVVEVCTELGAR